MPIHPKCQKQFPANNTHGHCAACCETFVGLTAFDAHRVGDHGADRRCELQPYETTGEDGRTRYGHWEDERGYWKHGRRLTTAEKEELWGAPPRIEDDESFTSEQVDVRS